jgi:hypothetical protein
MDGARSVSSTTARSRSTKTQPSAPSARSRLGERTGSSPGWRPCCRTAKLNGLDPEAYLRTVLLRIADHPAKKNSPNLCPVVFFRRAGDTREKFQTENFRHTKSAQSERSFVFLRRENRCRSMIFAAVISADREAILRKPYQWLSAEQIALARLSGKQRPNAKSPEALRLT